MLVPSAIAPCLSSGIRMMEMNIFTASAMELHLSIVLASFLEKYKDCITLSSAKAGIPGIYMSNALSVWLKMCLKGTMFDSTAFIDTHKSKGMTIFEGDGLDY